MMTKPIAVALGLALLAGCDQVQTFFDPNSKPIYGAQFGLPVNCRAYVQVVIDGYRSKKYTADESMAGLERNCGMHGAAWGQTK